MNKIIFLLALLSTSFSSLGATIDSDEAIEKLISQMTLKEKIDYIGGHNAFYIRAIDRLELPELKMADGPCGIRNDTPTTVYPSSICLAATWDKALAHQVGAMLGYDARARDVHFLLAPGMNLCRNPLCGRNFEYFGEDPHLAAKMAVEMIKGIQSQNVVATAKHYAVYNQEYNRHEVSSDIDERTLRELYLPAFEASVKEANVGAIMNSYNLINGIHASEHGYLNNDIAKNEWGFTGLIMSDWISTYNGINAANGGLDLEMPYAACMNHQTLSDAIDKGLVKTETIDDKVRRILRVAKRFNLFDRKQQPELYSCYNQEGRKAALDAALGGIVLLKNRGVLPLDKKSIQTIAVIGSRACEPIPHGGGSSDAAGLVFANYLQAIGDEAGKKVKIYFNRGIPDLTDAFDWNNFTTTLKGTTRGLVGEYFDNSSLQGTPALTRIDPKVDFHWKEKSYRPKGPVNHFSARWTGYFKASSDGNHTFYINGNDGFRLYIDDELHIDRWQPQGPSLQHKTFVCEADKSYKICLEYYVEKGSQKITFGIATGVNTVLSSALDTAKNADVVIVCAGFNHRSEGEDWDRSFHLPEAQDELISALVEVNPNVIVVLTGGGNVDMNAWIDKTAALVHTWYPGQEGGRALAKILFGKVSPSGKLPISFEKQLEDNPTFKSYHDMDNSKRVCYSEGLFLGYRHYDKAPIKARFPFGYGLSYTSFEYSNLQLVPQNNQVMVSFQIKNTGHRLGAEIAQVYVRDKEATVIRPLKELKGFTKHTIEPGRSVEASVALDLRAFSYYDVESKTWKLEAGDFDILVGSSAEKIELQGTIYLPK